MICLSLHSLSAPGVVPRWPRAVFKTSFWIDNGGSEAVKSGRTDSNQTEDIFPARFFAPSGPANHRIEIAGKKKGRTMKPLTQSKDTIILPVLIALMLVCFGLSQTAQAVCQEGCDFSTRRNTFLGEDALINNTSGINNTATGAFVLRYNTFGANNTATGTFALQNNTAGSNNTGF